MIEVKIEGRGGQGVVTSAHLLAMAAFFDGKSSQAFPAFGAERREAIIKAFCRIDGKPIRLHQHVYEPDYLILLDDSLAREQGVFDGLKGPAILVSSKKPSELRALAPKGAILKTVDAEGIALDVLGKPFVDTAVLGAFARASGAVSMRALEKAFREHFPKAEEAEKNARAARKCFDSLKQ